jgi:hypothetical protein
MTFDKSKTFVLRKVHQNLEEEKKSSDFFDKSKNAYAFFSCFGSEDLRQVEERLCVLLLLRV